MTAWSIRDYQADSGGKWVLIDEKIWDFIQEGLDNMREQGWFNWMNELPWTAEWKREDGQKFLISHSYAYDGIETMEDGLIWGRDLLRKPSKYMEDFINIYGHTPLNKPTQFHNKHWCIDTGCFHSGILTGIDLNTMEIYSTKGKN